MSKGKRSFRGWLLIISLAVIASLGWDLLFTKQEGISITEEIELEREDAEGDLGCQQQASSDQTAEINGADTSDKGSTDQSFHSEIQDKYPVYIVGAVNNPGIYKITETTCLYELIEQAGGMTKTAAKERINLAARLSRNQLIRIPTYSEWQDQPEKYDYEGIAGEIDNKGTILVNINYADAEELETLPGIGPATAKAIIEHRNKNGRFNSIEDLMLVTGIKENRFASLRDLITS